MSSSKKTTAQNQASRGEGIPYIIDGKVNESLIANNSVDFANELMFLNSDNNDGNIVLYWGPDHNVLAASNLKNQSMRNALLENIVLQNIPLTKNFKQKVMRSTVGRDTKNLADARPDSDNIYRGEFSKDDVFKKAMATRKVKVETGPPQKKPEVLEVPKEPEVKAKEEEEESKEPRSFAEELAYQRKKKGEVLKEPEIVKEEEEERSRTFTEELEAELLPSPEEQFIPLPINTKTEVIDTFKTVSSYTIPSLTTPEDYEAEIANHMVMLAYAEEQWRMKIKSIETGVSEGTIYPDIISTEPIADQIDKMKTKYREYQEIIQLKGEISILTSYKIHLEEQNANRSINEQALKDRVSAGKIAHAERILKNLNLSREQTIEELGIAGYDPDFFMPELNLIKPEGFIPTASTEDVSIIRPEDVPPEQVLGQKQALGQEQEQPQAQTANVASTSKWKPKYHIDSIKRMYNWDLKGLPDWDMPLQETVTSTELSKEDIIFNCDTLISVYGQKLLIRKRLSDGDLLEFLELTELQYSLERGCQKGSRTKSALVPISSLVDFSNKLSRSNVQTNTTDNTLDQTNPEEATSAEDLQQQLGSRTNAPKTGEVPAQPIVSIPTSEAKEKLIEAIDAQAKVKTQEGKPMGNMHLRFIKPIPPNINGLGSKSDRLGLFRYRRVIKE